MESRYYIGLDIGTDSVGWAATNPKYEILKFKGKLMIGSRLFDSAILRKIKDYIEVIPED